ncbi:hypothetical protein [Bacillus atrophaeus]|uniref:hypothetical protein n=1 Tax=Bacillus atrophaeus TaxID=1452 RepID=UPI000D046724|nr:hypothetical protein [Bacillus atrophaeus]MCY9204310.1 hypothetical protein [Bacillus atrophaeus]MEC0885252.1 hypothetical protein [Bacillus atrophaeus]PRR87698.1 hypothetical protein C6W23_17110 [Bacillus atrophaeus]
MKKLIIIMSVALSILTIGIGGSAYAAKPNTGDTTWTNHYKWYNTDDHTPARKKTNKTAYFNKVKSTDISYINIWAALYDGRDVSEGHTYSPRKGDKTYLYNKAVEKHGKGIAVRIDSRRYSNGSASGVWSPDSI